MAPISKSTYAFYNKIHTTVQSCPETRLSLTERKLLAMKRLILFFDSTVIIATRGVVSKEIIYENYKFANL